MEFNSAFKGLKPEISSDSPSVKSKGVRFVSAKEEVNQQTTWHPEFFHPLCTIFEYLQYVTLRQWLVLFRKFQGLDIL
jgi:hypothetical protein